MATKFQFGSKVIEEPGSFSQIKSGIKNPPLSLSFGNVLIIDTGQNAGFGANAGVAGTLTKNKDSIRRYTDLDEFKFALRGGPVYRLAEPLFQPDGFAIPGVSQISFLKAASTVPAEITYTFVGGGGNGGSVTIQVRNEGIVGNGIEGDAVLATTSFTVTAAGSAADTIEIKVDEGGGPLSIGIYVVVGGDVASDVATGIAAAISANSLGYKAVAVGALVTITSRNPKALEEASDANAFIPSAVLTGGVTTSALPGTFLLGVDGSLLTRGVEGSMLAGPNAALPPDKFIIEFSAGTFTGLDEEGDPVNTIAEIDTLPEKLVTTDEFENIDELVAFMEKSALFNDFFELKSSTKVGDGSIDNADLIANTGDNKAAGGTEVYSSAFLDQALTALIDEDYTHVLALDSGVDLVTGARSALNGKILSNLINEAKFDKYMVVGGGEDEDEFEGANSSIAISEFFDSNRLINVHAGLKRVANTGTGFKNFNSLFKAAAALGRVAGLPPQVPGTFKSIGMDADRHDMTEKQRKLALKKGVLHTKFDSDFDDFIINQAITSIQDNDFVVNPDATSHSWAVERIKSQLNKILVVNSKIRLLGREDGVNRNTISIAVIEQFTKDQLGNVTADDQTDNLILSFEQVKSQFDQDAIFTSYGFVPNFEVTKLFFTGFMLDPNLR